MGAVLTQNTNWSNVEKAIDNLERAGVLNYTALESMDVEELADYIRPSGYYNLKARRLKNLLEMISTEFAANFENLRKADLTTARRKLLGVNGIGPETADSILLYGCEKATFVVDTYTYRVMCRHNLIEDEVDYETLQSVFMDNMQPDPVVYNQFHALLVKVAATYCRKKNPLCVECPLEGFNL